MSYELHCGDAQNQIPYGYCGCGCGQKTNLARQSSTERGHVKGEPYRFIALHQERIKTIAHYFWNQVTPGDPDACWLFQGTVNPDGYGRIRYRGKWCFAHRVSYELHHGTLPAGLCALHDCDNPPCCNPKHLFAGTRADNNADMKQKKRHCFGESSPWAKLTDADVIQIRLLAESGLYHHEIAAMFGVARTTISSIIRRKRWSHVP